MKKWKLKVLGLYISYISSFTFWKRTYGKRCEKLRKREDMDRFGAGVVIPINLLVTEERTPENYSQWNVEGQMIRDDKMIRRLRNLLKITICIPNIT